MPHTISHAQVQRQKRAQKWCSEMVIFGPFCSRFTKSPRRRFRTNVRNMFIMHRLNTTSHHLITAYRKRLRNGSIYATKVLIPPLALCACLLASPCSTEVVLRKGQRLLDKGPYTGAWTEAALAPHAAAAHRASPPSPTVTGRHRPTAAQPRSVPRNAARAAWASWAAAPAAPSTTASAF